VYTNIAQRKEGRNRNRN